ncbi:MAG: ABC transporter substrate-binding protein [Bacillota bacterium]|nr:ABC transporter substrate-binding protein [Bacillota bacterium]
MKKLITILLSAIFCLSLIACSADKNDTDEPSNATEKTVTYNGQDYTIPADATRIVGATPSVTEIIAGLGAADKLVAVDNYSTDVEGIDTALPTFDTMSPDIEMLMSLEPQILIASTNSQLNDDDPYKTLTEQGVTVIYMDNSVSLEGIMNDIKFLGEIVNKEDEAQSMADEMRKSIDEIADIGKTITDQKTVYFELAPSPNITTFGTGNFLNEILELCGAVNIFGDEEGWISPNAETIITKAPDVIITNVDYMDDQVNAIKAREGWSSIPAVANDEVYLVEANASSRPTQNVVKAMKEIAKAVYPEYYQ